MYVLEAHIAAGTTIEDAAKELTDFCNKIQDKLSFTFNGVRVYVNAGDTKEIVLKRFRDAMQERLHAIKRDRLRR